MDDLVFWLLLGAARQAIAEAPRPDNYLVREALIRVSYGQGTWGMRPKVAIIKG